MNSYRRSHRSHNEYNSYRHKIESLGFELISNERLIAQWQDIIVDFSEVPFESLAEYAMSEIYRQGKIDGVKLLQDQVKIVLGM